MASLLNSLFLKLADLAVVPEDRPEAVLEKRMAAFALGLVTLATALWALIYITFHEPLASAGSLALCALSLASLIAIHRMHRVRFFIYLDILAGLVVSFLDHAFLGGFALSGGVLLWSLICPLAATFFFEFKRAWPWWVAQLGLIILAGIVQPFLRTANNLPPELVTGFFVMNGAAVSAIVLVMVSYFVRQKNVAYKLLSIEQEKSEHLLLNILPQEIAAILKNESRTIADNYAEASILFADLVGFTPLTAQMAPVEMVNLLNHIFSYFDTLVEKYNLEKIRTIGDNYMVASGVPRVRSDHALALAKMALEMRDFIYALPPVGGKQIQFRIGINSGSVVGGVIGRKKFVYDLWGDAVNIASRMESHGIAGAIQITQSTYELVCSECDCEPRGTVDIKGKGQMQTWFLVGLKASPPEAEPQLP